MFLRFALFFNILLVCSPCLLPAQVVPIIDASKRDETFWPLKKCWEFEVSNIGRSTVSASNGTIYVAEAEGRVRALNLRSGTVKWVTELGGRVSALLAIPEIGIAAITTAGAGGKRSTLRLMNADTGLVRYSRGIEIGEHNYLLSGGTLLTAFDSDGTVIASNIHDGTVKWRNKLPGRITTSPASSYGNLVVATDDNKLSVISNATGSTVAVIPTERPVTALKLRENGMIIAGDDRGRVTNYRDNSGAIWWRFKSGARVGTISETDEGLLIGSYDNFLYLVSKYTGDVRWKRRLDGRILSQPAIVADRIVMASSTEENAHVFEAETGKPVDRIAFGANRFMLAQPYVSEENIMVFTVVDGIMAFAPNGCSPN